MNSSDTTGARRARAKVLFGVKPAAKAKSRSQKQAREKMVSQGQPNPQLTGCENQGRLYRSLSLVLEDLREGRNGLLTGLNLNRGQRSPVAIPTVEQGWHRRVAQWVQGCPAERQTAQRGPIGPSCKRGVMRALELHCKDGRRKG